VSNPYNLRSPGSADARAVVAAIQANWSGPVAKDGEVELKPSEHDTYKAYKGWYQLYANVYAGGSRVMTPPGGTVHHVTGEALDDGTYLARHEKESPKEFKKRLKRSFNLPYCRDVVRNVVATMLRQDPDRSPLKKANLDERVLTNIDLRGHSVREFMRRNIGLALIEGWVGVLTDTNRTDPDAPPDDADRPYSQVVLPLRLWNWVRDPKTKAFLVALIQISDDRWKWWTTDMWIEVDSTGAIHDQGVHEFGEVPLDILVCEAPIDDADQPFGISLFSDAAPINLDIYQMCSLLEDNERKALFSLLHIKKNPPLTGKASTSVDPVQAPDVTAGPGYYVWADQEIKWVESDVSVPKEARDQIQFLVEQIRRVTGVSVASEQSVEANSGIAHQWEHSTKHNVIYECAQNIEDFESRLWQRYANITHIDIPVDSIRYPKDYAIQPVDAELAAIDKLLDIAERLQSAPAPVRLLVALKLRRVAIKDVGHLPEIDALLEKIDALLVDDEEKDDDDG